MKPVAPWVWGIVGATAFGTVALWWPGRPETFETPDARIGPGGVDTRPGRVLARRQWGLFGYATATQWRDGPDDPWQRQAEWLPVPLALTALANAGLIALAMYLGRRLGVRRA